MKSEEHFWNEIEREELQVLQVQTDAQDFTVRDTVGLDTTADGSKQPPGHVQATTGTSRGVAEVEIFLVQLIEMWWPSIE